MIKSIISFIKIYLTRKSFPQRGTLSDSDPMSSSYLSSHDKRKESSLRVLARKGDEKYGLLAMLFTYQIMSLLKDGAKEELKNKIDDLIKLLFDWKEKLDKK